MKKIFHLGSCSTCQRILKELDPPGDYELRDIGQQSLTVEELNDLKERAGSCEALFSRRARLYRERGLQDKTLQEADYKTLLLDHYTFLKRPVIVSGEAIFIGNSPKTVAAAKEKMGS